jgi:Kef-type K+ transport system membrane component KefB
MFVDHTASTRKIKKPLITIWFFNLSLICGIIISQLIDLENFKSWIFFITNILLAYIMLEVGLEFLIQKKRWKRYLIDYGVASLAAGLPWMFCFIYFNYFGSTVWQENLLLSRFAAPTATGILFAMLGIAGLGTTWLFKKIEVLVILDDLDTILFLIPIQFLLTGGRIELISVATAMMILVILGWRYMHTLKLPATRPWLFLYAIVLATITGLLEGRFGLQIEVLLPAFILGLLLHNPHGFDRKLHIHEHDFIEPNRFKDALIERTIKLIFMFFVGLLLPKITVHTYTIGILIVHVIIITFLMNFGKLAPIFFYRKEASFRERVAVSVGMMPRGEMGAGIITIALAHGINNTMVQASVLSLAFNLFLTGFFIATVIWLLKRPTPVK